MKIIDARVRLPYELRPDREQPSADMAASYDSVLAIGDRRQLSREDLVASMDNCGVVHAVVHGEYERGDLADEMNAAVAEMIAKDPGRFSGVGSVSLGSPVMRMVRQVERAAASGLIGINLQPAFFGLSADHRSLYPVYSKSVELGLFVAIHTGINYSRRHPMDGDHPSRIDRVASDFNDLTIIACHAGWPWTTEMAAVLRRHPNVLVDFGAIGPRYLAEPDTGWEVLFRFISRVLPQQALFATDWPNFAIERATAEWRQLAMDDASRRAILHDNMLRLLKARSVTAMPSASEDG